MIKNSKPALGQPVEFKARMFKDKRRSETKWVRQEKPGKGLYIGQRTVFSGEVEWTDEYIAFWPKKHHIVYLVVESEYKNPIHCLPEDTRPAD